MIIFYNQFRMDSLLQTSQLYLAQFNKMSRLIYRHQFFQQIIIAVTVVLFFIIGRLSYQKKLTHLLQMVNDAESARKTLKTKLQKNQKNLQKMRSKRKILWILSVLVVISNAVYIYLTKSIGLQFIGFSVVPLILIWIFYQFTIKWIKWSKASTQMRLKNTSITAEVQIKQILKIFGQGLKSRLKTLYEADIQSQQIKQAKEQCKLYKCYNQKKAYQDLYKLYEQIIDEIKKVSMCDVCLSENNISVQKLGLNELENNIKNFKRIKSTKLNLTQKKQLVNRQLVQYQKMGQKLPNICKKGCCIKQKALIQNARNKYHERLKRTLSQLTQKK